MLFIVVEILDHFLEHDSADLGKPTYARHCFAKLAYRYSCQQAEADELMVWVDCLLTF